MLLGRVVGGVSPRRLLERHVPWNDPLTARAYPLSLKELALLFAPRANPTNVFFFLMTAFEPRVQAGEVNETWKRVSPDRQAVALTRKDARYRSIGP